MTATPSPTPDANHAPDTLALSKSTVEERQSDATVGTLSTTDPDATDTHTYTLVPGAGDSDNTSFAIDGNTLKTLRALDFEAQAGHSVRVEVSDGRGGTLQRAFEITVTDVNDVPSGLDLSGGSVAENAVAGTAVGTLSASDQDAGQTLTYSLVSGVGDTDNAKFVVDGSTLKTDDVFDFETKSSYAVRLGVSDGNGGTSSAPFTITVTDVNEAPHSLTLSDAVVEEQRPAGTVVGTFSALDPDAGQTLTYSLVAGSGDTDNASFTIDDNALKTAETFDFDTKSSYSIRAAVSDGHGATTEKTFTITVTTSCTHNGTAGPETITGTPGDDYICGNGGGDTINGLGGADTILGGTGVDTIDGGEGADLIYAYDDGDEIIAGPGLDLVFGGAGHDNIAGGGDDDTLFGETGDDTLDGGAGSDRLQSADGNDTLAGGTGEDRLLPGVGSDSVDGGDDRDSVDFFDSVDGVTVDLVAGTATEGADSDTIGFVEDVFGSAHADDITGDAGANAFLGAAGDDTLRGADNADQMAGGSGIDTINGDAGDDLVLGDADADLLDGGAGSDRVEGGSENDDIAGGIGQDDLRGDGGNDSLLGGDDHDVLRPGDGDDTADGGAGDDVVSYSDVTGPATIDLEANTATGGVGSDTLSGFRTAVGSPAADTLSAATAGSELFGGSGDDAFVGGAGPDTMRGGPGDDQMFGNGGVDLLAGNEDHDTIKGGADEDQLFGDAGIDVITGDAGADTIYGGDDDDSLGGDDDNDLLYGEAGVDTLLGGDGDDRLTPSTGTGQYVDGQLGSDTLTTDGIGEGVEINLGGATMNWNNGSVEVIGVENATGTAFGDIITGDGGANVLQGMGGGDVLAGLGANDNIHGGDGDDTADGGLGVDNIYGEDDSDTLDGGDDGDYVSGGGGGDALVAGGQGPDSVVGGDGADVLSGGDDNDDLDPGAGDDSQIDGGSGHDGLVYAPATGALTIDLDAGISTGGGGNDQFTSIESASGGDGDDTIFGGEGTNQLAGNGGNDTVNGRSGEDDIYGGPGDDSLRGGPGTDEIFGEEGTDICGEASDIRTGCELSFNEPPILTIVGASNSFTEDDPAKAIDGSLTLTDDEANTDGATVTIGSGFESGKDVLSVGAALPAGVTANYVAPTLSISGTATVAQYETLLRSVRFQNTSQDPSTATRTISFSVTDGEFTDSGNDVSMSVQRVNDPPVADADSYGGGTRGVRMRVGTTHADAHETEHTGKVLDGDTDVDTPAANLTVTPGTITSADCAGVCPGNVTMQSDGTFIYDPPAGDDGTDSFTYTVEDNDTGDSDGTEDTHTATVTLTRSGPRLWFVDDSAAPGGRGVSHAPLQSLAPLAAGGARDAQDGAGDRIFVYSGTYPSGIDLEADQKLLGEPEGLNANSQQFVAAGGTKPAISSPTMHAVALHSGNEVQDVSLGNTPAGSYSLHAPAGAGAFRIDGTDIDNATGGGLQLEDGTPTVVLGTLSSSGSSANALRIVNTDGGSVTSTGGVLQNAAGAVVTVSGAASSLTLGSDVSDDTGQLISMSSSSGAATFNGKITDGEDGDGDGIAISTMSAPVAFTNELLLSTNNASAPAFSMTSSSAGNLRIDPPGTTTTNRLSSSGHAALLVTDTPVHADGLQFQRISTSGTFGDRDGIRLENTGSAGRLNVTGTGVANSGGQILGRQEGIRLINTNGPSLNWMKLSGHADYAIRGITVRGFNMDRTVIDGSVPNVHGLGHNGSDTNANESSVRFNELTGTGLTISNSTIKNGYAHDFRLENSAGTLNRLTVTGTTFNQTFTTGEDSVLVESSNTAVLNATFEGNSFLGARGDHIDFNAVGNSASDVVIRANNFTNNHPNSLGGQINAEAGASGDLTYDIDGNNIRGAIGTAIVTGKLWGGGSGDGTAFGRIRNNIVGQSGVAGSGSTAGSGIDVSHLAQGTHTVAIQNNQVRQYNQHGILINVGGASRTTTGLPHTGTINLTVTGNAVAEPANITPSTSSGLQLIAGTNSGDPAGTAPDQYNVCLGLSGNNLGAAGDESSSAGRDYILRQRFETVVRLPGYIGPSQGTSADMTNALTSYMSGRDTGAGGPFSVFASAESTDYDGDTTDDDGFLNTVGGAACPTP